MGRRSRCLALLATALVVAGCGQDTSGADVVEPGAGTAGLAQVEWQLLEVAGPDGSWAAQQLDSVLRFDGRGGWTATACNHLAGTARHGNEWVELTPGSSTAMACTGDAQRLERAVGAVLQGRVGVDLADGVLRLGPPGGTQLVYRERASIYPTTSARTLAAGAVGQAQYRVALSGAGDALGLVLEARPAPGTAWGTSGIGGPQPALELGFPYSELEVAGRHLVTGFAPGGTARVEHRRAPGERPTGDLVVHELEESPWVAWHGFVDTASTERSYTAYAQDGSVLATW